MTKHTPKPPAPSRNKFLLGGIVCIIAIFLGSNFVLFAFSHTQPQFPSLPPLLPQSPFSSKSHSSPLVSIITPTKSSRHKFHKHLYECFQAQTYPNKELIVLDEGSTPSPFFTALKDERVRYIPQTQVGEPVGRKRNILLEAARGDIIVHFDDDDFYADQYVEWMVHQLNEQHADMVTLSGIFFYGSEEGFFGYWDKTINSSLASHPISLLLTRDTGKLVIRNGIFPADDQYLYGFGYTYVYTRRMATLTQGFDASLRLGEDYNFVLRALKLGLKISAVQDTRGVALKTFHRDCSSNLLAQYRLPGFMIELLFGSRVLSYLTK